MEWLSEPVDTGRRMGRVLGNRLAGVELLDAPGLHDVWLAGQGGGGASRLEPDQLRTMLRGFIVARNGAGVHQLAQDAGLSADELRTIINEVLDEQRQVGTEIRLGERYDIHTGHYSTLEEFVERLLADT